MKKTLLFIYVLITSTFGWAQSLPTVTTDSVTNITATTAMIYGNGINDGGSFTHLGFCYSTSPNPTILSNVQPAGTFSLSGSFNNHLSGLSPNTTFYVRAYATNAVGTSYGSQLQFTTGTAVLASVTFTNVISNITATSAIAHANVTNDGNDPGTYSGVCHSTSPNPTVADSVSYSTLSGAGLYDILIDSLTPNTTYYARPFTINAAGTSYGSQLQFTTSNVILASITTDSVNSITATSAVGFATITNGGNDPHTTFGICFSTSANPTINDHTAMAGTFSVSASFSVPTFWGSLSPNTIYYMRAYATNIAGTAYGSQLQFTTGAATLAVVTSDSIKALSDASVMVSGNVINTGNDPNYTKGFCYSTSPNPTIANTINNISYSSPMSSFSNTISPLSINTTYYIRAYVTNAAGTSYSSQLQYSTPRVVLAPGTNDSVGNITATTAVVYGYLTNSSHLTTNVGFCYSTSPNPTIANSIVTAGTFSVSINFSAILSGLTPNTTYYVRDYTTDAAGTAYGNQLQFTTGICFAHYATTYDTLQNMFTLTVDSATSTYATAYRWDFGDGGSSTLATPSHTYTADTTYNVCLNVKGANGDSCSYCHVIGKDAHGNIYRMSGFSMKVVDAAAPLAIENHISTNDIAVFPNPTTGYLTLTIPAGNGTVSVYNVIGEKVYQSVINNRQLQIDLSTQPTGVYFIAIQTDKGTVNKKIVVSH